MEFRSPAAAAIRYEQEHIDLVEAIRKDEPFNDGWHAAASSFTAVFGPHGDLLGPGGAVERCRGQKVRTRCRASYASTPRRP